jgi:hypothetical protein
MDFEQLSTDYQDDYIAEAMLGRETEWFHYSVDLQNFTDMLAALPADAADKRADLERRIADTKAQMDVVERVYAALKLRIRDPKAHAAAIERVKAKRAAAV